MAGKKRVFDTRISTPVRLWTGIAVPIALVLVAWLVLAGELGGLRAGFTTIGAGTAPGVEASARLSYDLSDLDNEVVTMLLVGDQSGLGENRATAYGAYQHDIEDANTNLALIGSGIDAVPDGSKLLIQIENGLSAYEHAVDDAMYVDSLAHGRNPAQPSAEALGTYQHAVDLLSEQNSGVLALATQLIGAEQGTIEAASVSKLGLSTQLITVAAVLLALVLLMLVFVQRELGRRFMRRFNPSLLLATLLTIGFGVGLIVQVQSARGDYTAQNAASSGAMVELWQVQADAAQMRAADGRFLLDVGAGHYGSGQTVGAASDDAQDLEQQEQTIFGLDELIFSSGTPTSIDQAYQDFVGDDSTLRTEAGESKADKLAIPVSFELGDAQADFEKYITALRGALADNESAFNAAMASGRTALGPWQWLPAVWAPVIALLVLSGFAPRLREYR
ncbi:hypothetical protein [Actinospica robiniae]|uniref:hypothetical protein n=1 Tax=Actinospica robiniae TaxID=304901 RepID=UPI0004166937|nr:hypothetical protein [Actinospica robiniae]